VTYKWGVLANTTIGTADRRVRALRALIRSSELRLEVVLEPGKTGESVAEVCARRASEVLRCLVQIH
jgi:hypothetical protein